MIEHNKLTDDELEAVSGGARKQYNDAQLRQAGVEVVVEGGKKVYKISVYGKKRVLNESEAFSVADCFDLSGHQRLTDAQLVDLLTQS